MSVQKFRSIEDLPPPPAPVPGSEEHLRRWKALWDRAHALSPRRFRRGVVRYRSIEQAWADDFEAPG